MRILLVNHTPLEGSGTGTYTSMLARGLAVAGHEVAVMTPLADRFAVPPGVTPFAVEGLGANFPSFTGHPMSAHTYARMTPVELRRLLDVWRSAIGRVTRRWNPDIARVQHLWIVARAATLAGHAPVVTCHGSEVSHVRRDPTFATGIHPGDPQRPGLVIAISDYVATRAFPLLDPDIPRVVLANPVDPDQFYVAPRGEPTFRAMRIGFAGRLVPYKRCDLFLACVAELRQEFRRVTAVIVGDGPERSRLCRLVHRLGIGDRVRFLGQLPPTRMRDFYTGLRALVVPGEGEPFGLVALEAAACGTAVLVAGSGGLAELARPPFVVCHEPGQVADLTARAADLLRYADDSGQREARSTWARRRYALPGYVDRVVGCYAELRA